jgi:hypothetical protein
MYNARMHTAAIRTVRFALAASVFVACLASAAPPIISGSPPTSVAVGSTYSFAPTVRDPDTPAKKLRFSITQRPAWASFSSSTGALRGTPAISGAWPGIVISVSDGRSTASLPVFSITATNPNSGPTISGTPENSVLVNHVYRFAPVAKDPDGDPLTFIAQNVPAWLSFDASDGSLSGTPSDADVGTYSDLAISVSDGTYTTSLPAFSITVSGVANGNGTAVLSWTPPTVNTDGSTLNDLSGYRIYYGASVDSLTTVISLNDPGLSSYAIDGLGSATYYFAVTAIAASGSESEKSTVVSKSVN